MEADQGARAQGGGAWTPLGPDHGLSIFNQFRDRSVYNSGTQNFAGRTIAAEIDPACVAGDCRLWIGNANGGVWMTDDALATEPAWRFISHTFEHQNVAALTLDPNDLQAEHAVGRHRRAQRVRQRLHGRRRSLSHDQRRQVVEWPHRRGAVRRAAPSDRSPCSRATRT